MRDAVKTPATRPTPDLMLVRVRSQLARRRRWDLTAKLWVLFGWMFLMVAAVRFIHGVPPVSILLAGIGSVVAVVTALTLRMVINVSMDDAAAYLDREVPAAADRFQTWRALENLKISPSWKNAICQDVERFVDALQMPDLPMRWKWPVLSNLCITGLALFFLQIFFVIGMRSTEAERLLVASLLNSAAEDVEATVPELPYIAKPLREEAERLRMNQSDEAREKGVRALAAALAGIRALSDAKGKSSDAQAKNGGRGEAGEIQPQNPAESGEGLMPAVPVMPDRTLSNKMQDDTNDAMSRRLDRLASRLEDKKRNAAGLDEGQQAAGERNENGDSGDAQSLLDQLAAGKNPSAPGSMESQSAAPGPGSEEDFGVAQGGVMPDRLDESTGPEMLARVPEGQNGSGIGFSIVSRESMGASERELRRGSVNPVEFREETMALEDIPPGAREMVRRYFESLRDSEE